MLEAYIHSVETAGTVDGSGIRYVIFFQGCPMRCKFCHNPDTWIEGQGSTKSVDELVEDILKYKEFFDFSGGGVTVSGGEPLVQKEFVLELFKELKSKDIHTALDTCGCVEVDDTIREIFKYTDDLLFDIKQLDNNEHKALTGQSNEKILKFLEVADTTNMNIWIKIVLLTGMTDKPEYLNRLAEYLKQFKHIAKIEILPYHEMGKAKWESLGYKYPLDIEEPSKKSVKRALDIFSEHGFRTLCCDEKY